MTELLMDHVREVTGETSPVRLARLRNAAIRLDVVFVGSRCPCALCTLPSRPAQLPRREARFRSNNATVPGHRMSLCDVHMARSLRSDARRGPEA